MPVVKASNKTLTIPGCGEEFTGEFTFVQAADCQLGMEWSCEGSWGYGQGNGTEVGYDQATWEHEKRWCRSFVKMMNEIDPVFAIMCGDLLDAWPAKWPETRERQKTDFYEIFNELKVPLLCVCGNHDVGNSPTVQTVERYRSDFGDDWYSFVCRGLFGIVINSQYYADPSGVGKLAREHEEWLEKQLARAKDYTHSVVFQHLPWFLNDPNEDKLYFNFEIEVRTKMMKKFLDAGISKVFCGHYHRNAGGWFEDQVEVIVTSAVGQQLGTDKNGFRVVKVGENEITHEYVTLDNV